MGTDILNFDTSKVTDMHNMFYNYCDKKLDVSHFDISNVQNLSHMFKDFKGTIIGKSFKTNIEAGQPIYWENL